MEFRFESIPRLSGWLGNPNWTGAFLATLMAMCWGALLSRVGGPWSKLFLIPLVGAGVFLVQTMSRGAAVALFVGMAVVAVALGRETRRGDWIWGGLALSLLVAYALWLGAGGRFVQGVNEGATDPSVANRWLIYQQVPAMLEAAPGGWKGLTPQRVYENFYQPGGRTESYSSLINSHATWMVSWPWWQRACYLGAWLGALILSWPNVERRTWWYVLALGSGVTAGVAAMFSSVLDRWELWVLPLLLLLAVVLHRLATRRAPPRWAWGVVAGTTAVILLSLWGSGFAARAAGPVSVRHQAGVTTLSKGDAHDAPRLVVFATNAQPELGRKFGHHLRRVLREADGWAIDVVHQAGSGLPAVGGEDRLVVVGDSFEGLPDLPADAELVVLNPGPPPDNARELLQSSKAVRVLYGDLYATPHQWAWETVVDGLPNAFLEEIPGQGRMFTDWVPLALEPIRLPEPVELTQTDATEGDATAAESVSPKPYATLDIAEMLMTQEKPGDFLVIDARSELFYQIGHIPGARNLPVKNYDKAIEGMRATILEAVSEGKQIILYCQNHHCPDGAKLARVLIDEFDLELGIYEGGWDQWQGNGLPVESAF